MPAFAPPSPVYTVSPCASRMAMRTAPSCRAFCTAVDSSFLASQYWITAARGVLGAWYAEAEGPPYSLECQSVAGCTSNTWKAVDATCGVSAWSAAMSSSTNEPRPCVAIATERVFLTNRMSNTGAVGNALAIDVHVSPASREYQRPLSVPNRRKPFCAGSSRTTWAAYAGRPCEMAVQVAP